MDWNRIQENWIRINRRVQQRWGKLTDEDLAPVCDQRDQLKLRIQHRYGVARDEAERQIRNWERKATEVWFTSGDTAPQ
jgi:uncharacterized protein YjbJ (UPF0337 family)